MAPANSRAGFGRCGLRPAARTYQSLNSGCVELTQVDLSGYGEALGRPPIGPTFISHVIVFKTKMKKADADWVDWAKKEL